MSQRGLFHRFLLILPVLIALASWTAQITLRSDLLEHHPDSPISMSSLMMDVPRCPVPDVTACPLPPTRLPLEEVVDSLPETPFVRPGESRGPPSRPF